MPVKILLLATYFIVLLVLGFLARSRLKDPPSEYFLAGRKLGPFVLIFTMAATNFSAFTVFGTSGAAYRDGLAFFPIMGFGTGFMALTFWIIGKKVWEYGRKHNLVSPPELVGQIYNSQTVRILTALVMIIYTVPYLAIQPMSAGYALTDLFGINHITGAAIITGVMIIYVFRGGLKAIAWNDVFQGLMMFGLMITIFIVIIMNFGGLNVAIHKIKEINPEFLSRPGAGNAYPAGIWFSYIALWFMCDPMFPQLFQRFYTAKSIRSLAYTMLFYPLICTCVFIIPITIGLLGRLLYPNLDDKTADKVISMVATEIGGDILGTLVITAGLAALISTMDSQLLVLSSIFSRDIIPIFTKKEQKTSLTGRSFVLILALAGFAIAINPPATILKIVTWAFTGFAVLFPSVLFGLYLKHPKSISAISSILIGQILIIAYAMKLLPSFGFLPVIPTLFVSFAGYLIVQSISGSIEFIKVNPRNWWFVFGFAVLFILAMDFWNWHKIGSLWLGLPSWVWYFVVLSAIQTILTYYWVRKFLKK